MPVIHAGIASMLDDSLTRNQTPQAVPPPPQSGAPTSHEVNAGNDMQLELSTTDDAPELPVEPVPARSSWTPPPPPPPPAPEVQKRTQTKEELRREVEVHRVVETQLHGACKVAQV
jgi:hypothetical protein